jgi:hypothetical protein
VLLALAGLRGDVAAAESAAAAEGVNQPIFLLCPHRQKYSAWSLFLTVDKSDPSRVLACGLEKLPGKNSVDLEPNGYEAVLKAQRDPKTPREILTTLPATEFATGQLKIEKDNALHVSLTPMGAGEYRLMVSLRVSADERFTVGGKEQGKRDAVVRFDRATGTWSTYAVKMQDSKGNVVANPAPRPFSGILFPVSGTGIYRVVGVFDKDIAVELMDRTQRKEE